MFEGRKLERRLRAERPKPGDAFVTRMTERVNEEHPSARGRARLRVGTALAVAVSAVGVAGATGGLGYAASAITNTSSSLTHAVSDAVAPPDATSSPATTAPLQAASNVSAAADQYVNYYCYRHGSGNSSQYTKTTAPVSNNGWTLIWGPDSNGANRSCP